MSKSIMNTREKILDKALEMFNERGIEYVGLRELAGVLEMRVSNISYYFPTKDDLVYELSLQLRNKNAELITDRETLTMMEFLQMLKQVFNNHITFRCLLLSVVHLMSQNKHMAAGYKKTQSTRNATLTSNVQVLIKGDYLKPMSESEIGLLVSGISLISRFWISEAAVSYRGWSTEQQVRHYLTLITTLLIPHALGKAKREIKMFLEKFLVE